MAEEEDEGEEQEEEEEELCWRILLGAVTKCGLSPRRDVTRW